MATNFDSASDDDLTARLKTLFHETVRLQIMLEDTQSERAKLKDEHNKLASSIKAAHEEISEIIKEIRRRMPAAGGIKKTVPKALNVPVQSDLMHQTIFAATR